MKLTDTKYVIICGLMLLVCISIYARNVSVCGRVVDKYNGEPLIGACVYAAYTDKKDSLMAVADTAGIVHGVSSGESAITISIYGLHGYICSRKVKPTN